MVIEGYGVELSLQQKRNYLKLEDYRGKRYWFPKCYVCGRRFLTTVNPNLRIITCCQPEHKQYVIMMIGERNGSSINNNKKA